MIGPFKRMGHGPIRVGNESQDLFLEILQGAEISSLEQFAHQDAEPDFHLIHPGSVLRSVVKDDLVRWIVQKGRAGGHGLEDATLAFDA